MFSERWKFPNILLTNALISLVIKSVLSAFQPEFAEPIVNISVAVGRDATFTCHVRHLGGYRVGWLKADTKAIQAIHEHVITHNPRVSVTHSDQFTWNLHIKSVTEEDRGGYMCQLNTDPMKSQIGYLDVVIPPDFVAEDTSSDVIVPEGTTVKLMCRARGYPEPIVTWRREDGGDIILKDSLGTKTLVPVYKGEVLKLSKISRGEMGSYLCIASNGVPPSVSKRISLSIHFHPVIQVPNQLVGAPLGTDVQIECHVEASPKSINYWVKDTNEMIVSSPKYHVQELSKSMYETKMIVIVRKFQKEDVGSYRCIAKNSLGEVDSSIRIYEIPGPSRKILPPKYGTETNDILKQQNKHQIKVTYQPSADDEDAYGSSAEEFDENDMSSILYHQQKSTNKPSSTIFDVINSNSKHNNNHNHHHHQQNNIGVVGGNGINGGSGGIGTGSNSNSDLINGLVTRKPPFYIPEIRGDVNNELSHLGSNSISNIKYTTMSIKKSILLAIGVISSISLWLRS